LPKHEEDERSVMSTSEEADLAREKSEIDISFENVKD
jgi:hypothetical protein